MNMSSNFSNTAGDFVNEVEKFSKTNLNKKAELLRIYEESMRTGKGKEFQELAFTAKYLRGLMRVLQNGTNNPEVTSMENIKSDFSSNIKKVKEQIKMTIKDSDEQLKKHFSDNFFAMSQEGLINLNELLADLEWAKMYLNNEKRQKSN